MGHDTVLLVRHGRTAFNAERRFLGVTDVGLDPVGRVQARELSWHPLVLRADRVVSSPLRRARQTATLLRGPHTVHPGLAELDQGRLEGLDPATAFARHPAFFRAWVVDPESACVPGGEALGAARDRGVSAFADLVDAAGEGGPLVLVSHGLLLAALCTALEGAPLTTWRQHVLPHGGTRTLRWRRGRWTADGLR
ncbi:MAG: histidine phosphatase family protein [Alphaproteobacteria bacterium]|nr:histidine phosphatase family protein [Alphaproteobacteria bacterium]